MRLGSVQLIQAPTVFRASRGRLKEVGGGRFGLNLSDCFSWCRPLVVNWNDTNFMRLIKSPVVTQMSDARPTTGTVLAMPKLKKLAPIDTMRAIAWCHAVMSASKQTASRLASENFGRPNNPPRIEFPTYAKGGRCPNRETLDIVQAKYPDADLTATFETGPDFIPLWQLLSDECP